MIVPAPEIVTFEPSLHLITAFSISGYTGRVLLVHGSADTLVDPAYSEHAFEVYRACGAEATLKMISGAGHMFMKPSHMKEAKEILKAEFF